MEQLVIVLVVAAVGFIKWLMEKSAEQRAERQMRERMDQVGNEPVAPPIRAPRPTAFPIPDPDAAARKLREALGLPEPDELPPPRERPVVHPSPAFPAKKTKALSVLDIEQRVIAPPPLAIPVRKRAPQEPDGQSAVSGLDGLLRSRGGLRKAILVQEILGTPKGLVF